MRGMPAALVAAVAVVVSTTVAVLSQEMPTQKVMTVEIATTIAQKTMEKCRADGFRVSVAVLDRAGQMKAFMRDDGTGPHTYDTSRCKAYTSVTFRATTIELAQRVAANPASAALRDIDDVILLGGGVPIRVGNEVVGAVGVGGAPGGDKDEACAMAGLQAVADRLK